MNKSLITNLLSILIIIVGYLYQDKYSFIIVTGVFALSGSITNWLAIHMLFEKILDARLAELSPEDIKLIIQKMIKEHLGWLVVWGGFFGGLLGLILSPIGFNIL